ncbi:hypothetical protein Pan258_03160 [Symmachiella dynata]|nr:hypothetical protein Pan258_03160 [Symmachiella dynata]
MRTNYCFAGLRFFKFLNTYRGLTCPHDWICPTASDDCGSELNQAGPGF